MQQAENLPTPPSRNLVCILIDIEVILAILNFRSDEGSSARSSSHVVLHSSK